MRLRWAAIFAGLALCGCAGDLVGGTSGVGGFYAPQTYDYAYGEPYGGPGYVPSYGYQPGYVAPYAYGPTFAAPFVFEQRPPDRHWDHDRDRGNWSRGGGEWNRGQPNVWAGRPAGHPVNLAPPAPHPPAPHPPAPPPRAPNSETQRFVNALGIRPNH
jgi:hypothetical protein